MITVSLPFGLKVRPVIDALHLSGVNIQSPGPEICFDFSQVSFADPTGIVLLHNLTRYLSSRGVRVFYSQLAGLSSALRFMDDIGFFEDHLGRRLHAGSRLRPTTLRLREVHQSDVPTWINTMFVPWVSVCSNHPERSLGMLGVCVSEIFNNIRDHAGTDVGSIFGQWFPNIQRLRIAISDMGAGIPATVAATRPDIAPEMAILTAFQLGFSTQSQPRNRGAGLDYLVSKVCRELGGTITTYSGGRVVHADESGRLSPFSALLTDVGYAGTLFDIVMPTGTLVHDPQDVEVDVW
ncbi:ATP-binding protein [Paracoccus sp. SSJ]|uniref:ATP-binding protein n=1 Tax=Paracoccus sp. SSJ TaxID=3050636 RepID=UPI00254FDFA8|nr:ATP-binding protein [Paracoccus sp. SSJ]MDK8874379.1 hypothetical protein [Paracoccus sp. SSJ]